MAGTDVAVATYIAVLGERGIMLIFFGTPRDLIMKKEHMYFHPSNSLKSVALPKNLYSSLFLSSVLLSVTSQEEAVIVLGFLNYHIKNSKFCEKQKCKR